MKAYNVASHDSMVTENNVNNVQNQVSPGRSTQTIQ